MRMWASVELSSGNERIPWQPPGCGSRRAALRTARPRPSAEGVKGDFPAWSCSGPLRS